MIRYWFSLHKFDIERPSVSFKSLRSNIDLRKTRQLDEERNELKDFFMKLTICSSLRCVDDSILLLNSFRPVLSNLLQTLQALTKSNLHLAEGGVAKIINSRLPLSVEQKAVLNFYWLKTPPVPLVSPLPGTRYIVFTVPTTLAATKSNLTWAMPRVKAGS